MQRINFTLLLLYLATQRASSNNFEPAGIHFPLFRRSGRFSLHQLCNITELSTTLSQVEARYSRTCTEAEQNKIVRRWQVGPGRADDYLLNGAGCSDTWLVFEHCRFEWSSELTQDQGIRP